ncbi:MAG: DsbA family protein [Candidatus Paceibacterota bacterium]|jgi:protein-disulfide isomerase
MEKKENQLNINVPTAIIIAGLLVAGAIIFTNTPQNKNTGTTQGAAAANAPQEINIAPITDKDHFYGNPNAKVVMVEFSDLECPFCKVFHPTAKKVVDDSKGQVALVFRHFPIPSLHTKAFKEAEATECANEQGGNSKFWEYLDVLFATTPSNNGLDPAELPKIAVKIGLDETKFNSCLLSEKYKNRVNADIEDGSKVGVNGTPSTVLMNKSGKKILLVGAQPVESVQAAVEEMIK